MGWYNLFVPNMYGPKRPQFPGMLMSPEELKKGVAYVWHYCLHTKRDSKGQMTRGDCRPMSMVFTVLASPQGGMVKIKTPSGAVRDCMVDNFNFTPYHDGWHHYTHITKK